MAEIKNIKEGLFQSVREGLITPEQALTSFDRISPTQIRSGRVYEQKSVEQRIAQYESSRATRSEIKLNRIPFISESFMPGMWLSQGLIVVGAKSGRAKSTTASNIISGFLQSVPDKSAIVISNEEATDAIYERAACILQEMSYQDFYRGSLGTRAEQIIRQTVIDSIAPRVEVVEDGKYDMSYIDDVQSVLETAAHDKVGLVVVDYLQCITQCRQDPQMEAFQISKKLGFYLKDYGKQYGVPVVCFVQLKDGVDGADFGSRIQNDKTILNHSFLAVEIEPDFETLTTKFKIHKDRFFGSTGKEVVCDFVGGRYVFPGDTL